MNTIHCHAFVFFVELTSRTQCQDGKTKLERLEVVTSIIEAKVWCVSVYRRELPAAKQVFTEAVPEESF